MPKVVVAASALSKWVLPPDAEPCQTRAPAIAPALTEGQIDVCVPSLWYFEPLSLAYDIADLFKFDTVVPVAFKIVASSPTEPGRQVPLPCRDALFCGAGTDKSRPRLQPRAPAR